MSDQSKKPDVTWHLRELVAAQPNQSHGVLAAALAQDGAHPISRSQVYRLLSAAPQQIPLGLIGALCRVLGASPNDLFGWELAQPPKATGLQGIRQRGRRAAALCKIATTDTSGETTPGLSEAQRAKLVGPRVHAMPTHPLSRAGEKK